MKEWSSEHNLFPWGSHERKISRCLEDFPGFRNYLFRLGLDVPVHPHWRSRDPAVSNGGATVRDRGRGAFCLDAVPGQEMAEPARVGGRFHTWRTDVPH